MWECIKNVCTFGWGSEGRMSVVLDGSEMDDEGVDET